MTDRVPPKGKKSGKGKGAAKVKGPAKPKLDPTKLHGIGHNSGQVIPELQKIVTEILASSERMKNEAKVQRDLRNRAKSEFGVLSGPLAHEIRLRKMDKDVRVQFESSHTDLKVALGYQPSLDFQGGTPTNASVKAQPSEAEMAGKQPEKFHVEEGDEETDAEHADNGEQVTPIPDNLRRAKQPAAANQSGSAEVGQRQTQVIEREG